MCLDLNSFKNVCQGLKAVVPNGKNFHLQDVQSFKRLMFSAQYWLISPKYSNVF